MKFKIGDSAQVTKTITEQDIEKFAELSGDRNAIHLDEDYARGTRFQRRIAHGMLTASFASTVLAMQLPGPGTIYAGQTLQFRAPVFIGDTLTATVECTEKLDERKWVKFKTTVTNQDGKVVVSGEATVIPPAS